MSKDWRRTRSYRLWRVKVIRRDKVCQTCGSRLNRHAHHLNSGSYFKEERFDTENGICLCRNCHLGKFHGMFMGSSRKKTTKKDFDRFDRLYQSIVDDKDTT